MTGRQAFLQHYSYIFVPGPQSFCSCRNSPADLGAEFGNVPILCCKGGNTYKHTHKQWDHPAADPSSWPDNGVDFVEQFHKELNSNMNLKLQPTGIRTSNIINCYDFTVLLACRWCHQNGETSGKNMTFSTSLILSTSLEVSSYIIILLLNTWRFISNLQMGKAERSSKTRKQLFSGQVSYPPCPITGVIFTCCWILSPDFLLV